MRRQHAMRLVCDADVCSLSTKHRLRRNSWKYSWCRILRNCLCEPYSMRFRLHLRENTSWARRFQEEACRRSAWVFWCEFVWFCVGLQWKFRLRKSGIWKYPTTPCRCGTWPWLSLSSTPPPSTLPASKTCLPLSCAMIPLNRGALPRNDKNRNPQANIHASVIRAII